MKNDQVRAIGRGSVLCLRIAARAEVMGFEPTASTLRTCCSQCFDQVLSEHLPGSAVGIPSDPLTDPPSQ
jgi:hypothetical protein